MAATDAFKNAVANAVVALGNSISLHSADPGTTGANEIAGGGYTRKTTTWGAAAVASGNSTSTGSTMQFDVEANDVASHYGVWNGGTFLYGRPLTPGVTINAVGNGKVDVTPTYTYAQA